MCSKNQLTLEPFIAQPEELMIFVDRVRRRNGKKSKSKSYHRTLQNINALWLSKSKGQEAQARDRV